MATTPTLIYCAAGNREFRRIAAEHGFANGARLPDTVYDPPLYFADQDWRRPDRAAYMRALAQHRPVMATVLDWERDDQLPDVLAWAEEAAQHVGESVVVVPKVVGGVGRLPRRIGGRRIVLGYSVPTRFGGTDVPAWELAGWPVHLLGGPPQRQLVVYAHLRGVCEVLSADGNYAQKMAVRWGQFWVNPPDRRYRMARWPRLSECGDARREGVPAEAFRRSCAHIAAAWRAAA